MKRYTHSPKLLDWSLTIRYSLLSYLRHSLSRVGDLTPLQRCSHSNLELQLSGMNPKRDHEKENILKINGYFCEGLLLRSLRRKGAVHTEKKRERKKENGAWNRICPFYILVNAPKDFKYMDWFLIFFRRTFFLITLLLVLYRLIIVAFFKWSIFTIVILMLVWFHLIIVAFLDEGLSQLFFYTLLDKKHWLLLNSHT